MRARLGGGLLQCHALCGYPAILLKIRTLLHTLPWHGTEQRHLYRGTAAPKVYPTPTNTTHSWGEDFMPTLAYVKRTHPYVRKPIVTIG